MGFGGDERGVTVQIGAVLLLGIVVLSLSVYQVTVVPADNEQVEFDHNKAVQRDMLELRNGLLRAGSSGGLQPTTVAVGTRYPTRTVFVNPPPATGRLRTVPQTAFVVDNATATGGDGETDDFWTGDERAYSTNALVYRPEYSVYPNAPTTVYESSVLVNRFAENTSITLTDQAVVDGRRITFVTVTGNLSKATSDTVSVDARPVSAAGDRVSVSASGGDNVTLTVPTTVGADVWRTRLLAEEMDTGNPDDDRYVSDVRNVTGEQAVEIELESGATYELGLARVGVGTGVTSERAAYLTVVDAPAALAPGETGRVVLEVRDRFNNPVSGVTVDGATVDGDLSPPEVTTSPDGRAVFEYSNSDAGTVEVTFTLDDAVDPAGNGFDASKPENASVEIEVQSGSGGSGGTELVAESFDAGIPDSWTEAGVTGTEDGQAYLNGDAKSSLTSPGMDTSGYDSLTLEYVVTDSGGPENQPDQNEVETLVVEYKDKNGKWVEIDTFVPNGEETTYDRELVITNQRSSKKAFHTDFQLRFSADLDAGSDKWYVDDVRVTGSTA
jgi:hypothetical protein